MRGQRGIWSRIDDESPADEFSPLTIAAHELKSPLATLRQLSMELQSDDLSDESRKTISKHMQLIAEKALRFSSDITRAESLQSSIFDTATMSAQAVCMEVIEELRPLYVAQSRNLAFTPSRHAGIIIANRDLLRRILIGFGDNAVHYTDAESAVRLFTQLVENKKFVRIGLRDEGPAMPASAWRLIKSNSPQLDTHRARRPESSGLGLLLAEQFAEAMGAKIGAIRHRDGATFYVDVPVSGQMALL